MIVVKLLEVVDEINRVILFIILSLSFNWFVESNCSTDK